jgi:pSer/pThr/pTyr-binding forkhead associated (FHA) protein
MKFYLTAVADGKEIGSFPLEKDFIIVGRSEECDIKIFNSAISRKHLKILRKEEGWFIQDLGSSGGTILNGNKIDAFKDYPLRPGDRINIPGAILIFSEERTQVKAEKTIVISRAEGVLVIDGERREILSPPFQIGGYSVERNGDEFFLCSKGKKFLRKRKLKDAIEIRLERKRVLLIPPDKIYIRKNFGLNLFIFFLSFLSGFVIFSPSHRRVEGVTETVKKEDIDYGIDEKRVMELMENRDWKGARAQIITILSSGKSFPSINENLRTTYEEEKNQRVFEEGKEFFEKGMMREAKEKFSEVPTGSVYFAEANRFLEEIEKNLSKEKKKVERKDIPPFLSFYLNGDLDSAMKEAKDMKLQIMISQLKSHLPRNEYDAIEKADAIDRKIDKTGKGRIAEVIKKKKTDFYIRKAKEALQNRNFEQAVENAEMAKSLSPSSEEVKKLYSEIYEMGKSLYEKAYFLMEANPKKSADILKNALPLLKGTDYERRAKEMLKKLEGER